MSVVAIAGDIAVCIGQRGERAEARVLVGVQDLGGLQVGDRYRRQVALAVVGVAQLAALGVGLAGGREGMVAVGERPGGRLPGAHVLDLRQVGVRVVGVGRLRVQGVDGLGGLVVVAEADSLTVVQRIDDLDDAPLAVPGVNGGVAVRISDRRFLVGDVVAEGGPGVGGISDAGHAVAGAIGDGGALVQGVSDAGELAAAVVAKAGGFACQIGDAGQVARRGAVLHGAARRVGDGAGQARAREAGGDAPLGISEAAAAAAGHLVAIPVFVALQATTGGAKDVDLTCGMEGERVIEAGVDQGGLDAGGIIVAAVTVPGEGGGEATGAVVVHR